MCVFGCFLFRKSLFPGAISLSSHTRVPEILGGTEIFFLSSNLSLLSALLILVSVIGRRFA